MTLKEAKNLKVGQPITYKSGTLKGKIFFAISLEYSYGDYFIECKKKNNIGSGTLYSVRPRQMEICEVENGK